jgi:PAS domain S-box-containing protein
MHAPVGLPEVSQGTYLVSIAVIDISERKIAEESLKEAGAFLNTLLNAIPVPLFYKDKEGLYIGFNKSYEEFYGKTQQELVGKSVFDIAARDLAEIYHAKDLELLDNPGAQVYDSQVKDARGAVHDVVFHKSTFLDRQGHVLGLIGVILDITERKRAAEREQLLGAAIEHAADGIVITDTTGTIQYVNPAEETISGYSRDELVGQGADIFKSDKHHEDFHRNLWETIRDGNVWSGRFINKKKDGTEYNEDATISPVYDKSGNLTNFVAVKHDVTKQLELQGQLFQSQKMEAVGTLAGGLAHDFNNMLQVIQGLLDVILSSPDLPPDEIRSILKDMEKAAASGAELIKGMMVFVRKTPLELRPIELNKLVAQTKSMLARSIPKMIEIDLLLDDDLWTINAAPNQIDQILMNLAINARDAMPDGGRLTIKTENITLDDEYCIFGPLAKPGRYALITVSDTGAGMNKETASHIFEPFFTTKEADKGTGLGLAVVYGIVEQHNGWIICDSELSVGSTFKIYFPAIEEVPQEQYFEKKEPPRGKGETILLVDDEPDLLQIIVRLLNRANYRVITSIHGKDALELYEKHRKEIRLVILDLLMPGMGGKECLRALFRMDPNSRVLMVSGYHEEGIAEKLKDAGAKGFMWKPFDEPELLEKIREIIDEE